MLSAGRTPAAGHPDAARRALRAIAVFELIKGVAALAAALGLLSLLHHDLHALALALIGRVGLAPGAHYPALLLHEVDLLRDANVRVLLLAVAAYVTVRLAEAYGLWTQRRWGAWLGALSGALYVPFELRHLLHRPALAGAAVLAANLTVVGFLVWRLRRRNGELQTGVPADTDTTRTAR